MKFFDSIWPAFFLSVTFFITVTIMIALAGKLASSMQDKCQNDCGVTYQPSFNRDAIIHQSPLPDKQESIMRI